MNDVAEELSVKFSVTGFQAWIGDTTDPAFRGRVFDEAAVDYLVAHGGKLAPLHDTTIEMLTRACRCCRSTGNPIDVGEDAPAECFTRAAKIVARTPESKPWSCS